MLTAGGGKRRLVLVGGGHSHAGVLLALGMTPEPGLDVTIVAKELDAPYSGMLPGYVAGHYDFDACHIDLVRLAHFAGARLIHGEVDAIDLAARRVGIIGRPPLSYNLLSLDTGITPATDDILGASDHAITVKPVSTFAPKWQALLRTALTPAGPRRLVVVGAGAAGLELVLAMRHRLRTLAPSAGLAPDAFSFSLIGSGELLPTHGRRARALARRALAEASVELIEDEKVQRIAADQIVLASGRRIEADATIIATKAAPPAWFAATGLARDDRGFIAVRPTLQAVGHDDIFAVGDCATVLAHPREKAGVFAVRQARPLTRNLRLRHRGLAVEPFTPQRYFLTLISLGDERAIASRNGMAASGRWAWTWKDRIDRKFMGMFHNLPQMAPAHASGDTTAADDAMLCMGCAAKLGPMPLARALDRLEHALPPPAAPPAARNLSPRDDAAVLDLGDGRLRLESIDHFPAIWPEPYVLGEIAAVHAIGDILAKGGTPDHALAVAGLPPAATDLVEDDLFQLLAGARAVLDAERMALVGGHTARTESLSVGFFVSGTVPRDRFLAKGGLVGGETLILTKPLGTGIVFAAWMRRLARAREVSAALAGMRRSSSAAMRILAAHGATGATDVTGFGLAGHLVEMLDAAGRSAEIGLAALPRYPGVDRLIDAGVRSSLLAENIALAAKVQLADSIEPDRAFALLFDPQTSGGLLAGIPEAAAGSALAALHEAGIPATAIGRVQSPGSRPGSAPALFVSATLPMPAT